MAARKRLPRRPKALEKVSAIEATAYHEAGHAVASHFLGLPFIRVHICADRSQGLLGAQEQAPVYFENYQTSDAEIDQLERRIIRALAGIAAESRLRRRLEWKYGADDFNGAFGLACARLSEASIAELEAYLKYCWVRANEFVAKEEPWIAIRAVAAALIQKEELSAVDVENLITDALSPFWRENGSPRSEVEELRPEHGGNGDTGVLRLLLRRSLRRVRHRDPAETASPLVQMLREKEKKRRDLYSRKLILLGVCHQMQHDHAPGSPWIPASREFRRRIDVLLESAGPYVVLEEALHGGHSFAEELAAQYGCDYENIDMTQEQRRDAGVVDIAALPDELYTSMGAKKPDLDDDPEYVRSNNIREEYFASRIDDWARRKTGTVVVILGAKHAARMEAELRGRYPNFQSVNLMESQYGISLPAGAQTSSAGEMPAECPRSGHGAAEPERALADVKTS